MCAKIPAKAKNSSILSPEKKRGGGSESGVGGGGMTTQLVGERWLSFKVRNS